MKTTSIVIPFFNHWEMTHQLLYDIYTQMRDVDEVVVVDNGSTEATGLDWWEGNGLLPLSVIHVSENEGFLRAANRGMRHAHGEVLILISNDVRIYQPVLPMIRTTLALHPKTVMGGVLYEHDTGWNTFAGRIYPYVEGWFLAVSRDIWKAAAGFDERYAPNDYEDVDFSTYAREKLGCKLMALPLGSVVHMGSQTIGYTDERRYLTEQNMEKFREKWVLS